MVSLRPDRGFEHDADDNYTLHGNLTVDGTLATAGGDAPVGAQQSHIDRVDETYAEGDLDTEAKVIAAVTAQAAAINAILDALEAFGITATE